ncbi:MAG: alanine dehydrogenase [Filimonas sp.]|nr:alanine dehydrogenase [Filimonas sp.]
MLTIGLIKEGKTPPDNRVALTPSQCKWINKHVPGVTVVAESSPGRCFSDEEYRQAGITVTGDVSHCDILLGIKEVPVSMLIPNKKYLFFSHTKKKQPYNQGLMRAMVEKNITLIDYECLEHEDGQRIIGFGFFAGVVGAHNGLMAYGHRTGSFELGRVYAQKDYRALIHTYFGLKLPNIKIAVTGSGRVAHGIVEVMNLVDVQEVEPDEFVQRTFNYPVYVHLKGQDLYRHKTTGTYNREDFHHNPEQYNCIFESYCAHTDVLMNGIYWDKNVPRLFEWETMQRPDFRIQTIADITDDEGGSIPCNLGDAKMESPVYGVNKSTRTKEAPYLPEHVDVMAVGNLPNELPRDASRYFGEQLIKYVLQDLLTGGNDAITRATILENGKLTKAFDYLADYAGVPLRH